MFSHQSSDSSEGFTALRRHDEYYLTGGDLFFLIEQNHFRVHRYFFERESSYFKAQLATPASPGASRQGTSESTSIVLDNVKSADFAKFLWVFYNPKYSLYKAKVDDWVAILELAHRWGFLEVKRLATRELEKLEMPDIDRIVAYHKFDIDRSLLIACYAALTEREDPLTLQEGLSLGMETTLKIFRAREVARATPAADGSRSPSPAMIPVTEMHDLIKDLFEITEQPEASLDDELVRALPIAKPELNGSSTPKPPSKSPAPAATTTNGTSGTSAKKPAWGAPKSITPSSTAAAATTPASTPSTANFDADKDKTKDKDEKKATTGGLVIHPYPNPIPDFTNLPESFLQVQPTPTLQLPRTPPAPSPTRSAISSQEVSPLPMPIRIRPEELPGLLLQTHLTRTSPTQPSPPPPSSISLEALPPPLAAAVVKREEEQGSVVDGPDHDGRPIFGEERGGPEVHARAVDESSDDDDETRVDSMSGVEDNEHDLFHDMPTRAKKTESDDQGRETGPEAPENMALNHVGDIPQGGSEGQIHGDVDGIAQILDMSESSAQDVDISTDMVVHTDAATGDEGSVDHEEDGDVLTGDVSAEPETALDAAHGLTTFIPKPDSASVQSHPNSLSITLSVPILDSPRDPEPPSTLIAEDERQLQAAADDTDQRAVGASILEKTSLDEVAQESTTDATAELSAASDPTMPSDASTEDVSAPAIVGEEMVNWKAGDDSSSSEPVAPASGDSLLASSTPSELTVVQGKPSPFGDSVASIPVPDVGPSFTEAGAAEGGPRSDAALLSEPPVVEKELDTTDTLSAKEPDATDSNIQDSNAPDEDGTIMQGSEATDSAKDSNTDTDSDASKLAQTQNSPLAEGRADNNGHTIAPATDVASACGVDNPTVTASDTAAEAIAKETAGTVSANSSSTDDTSAQDQPAEPVEDAALLTSGLSSEVNATTSADLGVHTSEPDSTSAIDELQSSNSGEQPSTVDSVSHSTLEFPDSFAPPPTSDAAAKAQVLDPPISSSDAESSPPAPSPEASAVLSPPSQDSVQNPFEAQPSSDDSASAFNFAFGFTDESALPSLDAFSLGNNSSLDAGSGLGFGVGVEDNSNSESAPSAISPAVDVKPVPDFRDHEEGKLTSPPEGTNDSSIQKERTEPDTETGSGSSGNEAPLIAEHTEEHARAGSEPISSPSASQCAGNADTGTEPGAQVHQGPETEAGTVAELPSHPAVQAVDLSAVEAGPPQDETKVASGGNLRDTIANLDLSAFSDASDGEEVYYDSPEGPSGSFFTAL